MQTPSITAVNVQPTGPITTRVAVNPSNISSTSPSYDPTPGGTNTAPFAINVTNVPPIHGFLVQLSYNHAVLHVAPSDIDPVGGVLSSGGSIQTLAECIDGLSTSGGNCTPLDSTGIVTLLVVISGPSNSTLTSGLLFSVTFHIVKRGVSQIHLLNVALIVGNARLDSKQYDGYFSNQLCSNVLCQPPVASFVISPPPPIKQGKPVTFNASLSFSPNPNAKISKYSWDWGATDLINTVTASNVTTQTFYSVLSSDFITLTVNDTYDILGSATLKVEVVNVVLDLSVYGIFVDKVSMILPGTPVNITAIGKNGSSSHENLTIAIVVVGLKVLKNQTFSVDGRSLARPLSVIWNTTGVPPRAYKIQAIVSPLRDSSGRIIEDDLSNNVQSVYVQLVENPGRTFVSLSLLQTTGLGLALLIGVGGVGAFLLKRRTGPEPTAL